MRTPTVPTLSLSPMAKAALAVWLAQAPLAPARVPPDHRALCARLAKSAKRSGKR